MRQPPGTRLPNWLPAAAAAALCEPGRVPGHPAPGSASRGPSWSTTPARAWVPWREGQHRPVLQPTPHIHIPQKREAQRHSEKIRT